MPDYSGDHPRSRGVYVRNDARTDRAHGSSPLARGLPLCSSQESCATGIIPARAGFTNWSVNGPVVWRDHPRSRGVYLKQIGRDVEKTGSSPLARGLLTRLIPFWEETRIIPARAGFTPIPWPTRWPLPDHPRSRGVYCARLVASRLAHGSSPLARGLRDTEVFSSGVMVLVP